MRTYETFIFDLYNTIILDDGFAEREQYRMDTIYSILEKSLYSVKFDKLRDAYLDMSEYFNAIHGEKGIAVSPFYQIDYLLNKLDVHDVVTFKKTYDAYSAAVLQLNPKLMPDAKKALEYIKNQDKKTGLISNTGKTPGVILRILLKELGVFDLFDDMIFSDEIGVLKPNLLVFDIALKRLEAAKDQTIFIGDRKYCDYDGALNAGLSAHLFDRDKENLFALVVNYNGGYK